MVQKPERYTFFCQWRRVVLLLCAAGLALGLAACGGGEEDRVLLTVNGSEVSAGEFALFLREEKALATSYFQMSYGAQYSREFWNTDFGGETPLDYAKALALEKLVRYRIECEVMAEYGVLEQVGFQALQMAYKEYQNPKDGEPTFGSGTFTLSEFLGYYHAKNLLALGQAVEQSLEPQKETLNYDQLYRENKEEYFHLGYSYRCTLIWLDNADAADARLLDAISALVDSDTDFSALASSPELLPVSFTVQEQSYSDDDDEPGEDYQNLKDFLRHEPLGAKTVLMYDDGRTALVQLEAREDLGFLAPEGQTELLFQLYCEKQLADLLEQRVAAAEIVLAEAYSQVEMP